MSHELKAWQVMVSTTLDCKDETEAKMTCELLQDIFSCLNAIGVKINGGMHVLVPTERAKEIMREQGVKLEPESSSPTSEVKPKAPTPSNLN